jgi:hypothetical protein
VATCTVYYDRIRRSWMTIVKGGGRVLTTPWKTEFAARQFLGLSGGSQDPAYVPPRHQGTETFEAERGEA